MRFVSKTAVPTPSNLHVSAVACYQLRPVKKYYLPELSNLERKPRNSNNRIIHLNIIHLHPNSFT